MSRAARITVGGVVSGVLAFVAVVAALMSGLSGSGFLSDDGWSAAVADESAVAEVLDVDDDPGWPTVDIRLTTADGEVVVTWVDWEHRDELPAVGDEIDIVYDSFDPEYAFAADDPNVSGAVPGGDGTAFASDQEAEGAVAQVAGWAALGALAGLALTVLLTVLAAVVAPSPPRHGAGQEQWPQPAIAGSGPADPGLYDPYDPYDPAVGRAAGAPPPGWSSPG